MSLYEIDSAPALYWDGRRQPTIDLPPSDVCVAQVKQFEGFRGEAYEDIGGTRTIGYGRAHGVRAGEIVDEFEATQMLIADINHFKVLIDPLIKVQLFQHEYDALLSFVYNIGTERFERSDVLRNVNKHCIAQAGDAMLGWCHVKGKVVRGLLDRRKVERRWLTGNPF